MVETLFGGLGALLAGYELWTRVIKPRLGRTRLRRAYELIEAWYEEIATNLEQGLNFGRLESMEHRVSDYLRDHKLEYYPLRFSGSFRAKFLRYCGIKQELRGDPELFRQYSRLPPHGTTLGSFWLSTMGAFYRFHTNYQKQSTETNIANVTMPLKALRMYLGVKAE